jgi:hypothetical protein
MKKLTQIGNSVEDFGLRCVERPHTGVVLRGVVQPDQSGKTIDCTRRLIGQSYTGGESDWSIVRKMKEFLILFCFSLNIARFNNVLSLFFNTCCVTGGTYLFQD